MNRLTIVVILCAIALIILLKYGARIINSVNERKILDKNKSYENAVKARNQRQTYSSLEYDAMASKIKLANKPWYEIDDTSAVESVFSKMRNELDVALLIKAFGIQDGMSLMSYLNDFLNTGEVENFVNKPLRANSVSFQF